VKGDWKEDPELSHSLLLIYLLCFHRTKLECLEKM